MSFLGKFWNKKDGKHRIFLDFASTTPVDREVLEAVTKYDREFFANPSALYSGAISAKEKLKEARLRVADVLRAQKDEIVFTSGGTEGNNLALLGIFEKYNHAYRQAGKENFTPHFVTTNIEHPAILEVFSEIERQGGEVTYVKVNEEGLVSAKDIKEAIKENTILVSVMYANNEIGTIQPIREIAKVIRNIRQQKESAFPYLHTDACQAGLYLSLDVLKLGVDLLTLDGIKIYGPRSSGVLFVKRGVELAPILFGGGQEKGLRSGTEDVGKNLGLALAIEKAQSMKESESERLLKIRDYAIDKIVKNFPKARLNGTQTERLPNNINVCFPRIDAEFVVISLDVAGISISHSSSCRNLKEHSSSYVVEALGEKSCGESSLRITLGRGSTKEEVDLLVSVLKKVIS